MENRPDFVKANTRQKAVKRMISEDPLLSKLYREGKGRDGKEGWINMIRMQHDPAYRLIFYLARLPLAPACGDVEPYEVLFGEIDPTSDEPNFPRALYTTSGGVNLMRDGIPGEEFIRFLKSGKLEIEPLPLDYDLLTSTLRDRGYIYLCLYDKTLESLRILDLREYSQIYFVPNRREIQVHNEDEIIAGDMTDVRPFTLKLAVIKGDDQKSEWERANEEAMRLLKPPQ